MDDPKVLETTLKNHRGPGHANELPEFLHKIWLSYSFQKYARSHVYTYFKHKVYLHTNPYLVDLYDGVETRVHSTDS